MIKTMAHVGLRQKMLITLRAFEFYREIQGPHNLLYKKHFHDMSLFWKYSECQKWKVVSKQLTHSLPPIFI